MLQPTVVLSSISISKHWKVICLLITHLKHGVISEHLELILPAMFIQLKGTAATMNGKICNVPNFNKVI